jgi:hypothetical protein
MVHLMLSHRIGASEALRIMGQAHPIIDPNSGFCQQLAQLEPTQST